MRVARLQAEVRPRAAPRVPRAPSASAPASRPAPDPLCPWAAQAQQGPTASSSRPALAPPACGSRRGRRGRALGLSPSVRLGLSAPASARARRSGGLGRVYGPLLSGPGLVGFAPRARSRAPLLLRLLRTLGLRHCGRERHTGTPTGSQGPCHPLMSRHDGASRLRAFACVCFGALHEPLPAVVIRACRWRGPPCSCLSSQTAEKLKRKVAVSPPLLPAVQLPPPR